MHLTVSSLYAGVSRNKLIFIKCSEHSLENSNPRVYVSYYCCTVVSIIIVPSIPYRTKAYPRHAVETQISDTLIDQCDTQDA